MKRLGRVAKRWDHRRGQSLVLMFFVLVALIGLMALTLDFGFVLLARRQMQTGVNTAAKEGLRGKGLVDYDANDEELRRTNARVVLRLTYDDDFDLSSNNTTLGAGIDSSLIQGSGFRSATIGPAHTTLSDDLANRSSFIYRPDDFQLNQVNADHGDMLVGNYNPASLHTEASDYARPDFDPSATDPSSFLVRMRRTHNPGGLDEVPDVSSRGGGLPLLLARAGWMKTEDGAAAYSIRRDGVTIRSTAIADAVPALAVGVADLTLTPTLAGVAPIAVALSGWQALTVNVTYALDTADGELADGGTPVATVRRIDAGSAVFVTGVVAAIEQSWPAPDLVTDGSSSIFYLPVYNSVSASGAVTEDLVIGFGRIQLSRSGTSFTVTPLSQVVAGENASSLPPVGWQSNLMSQLQANNTAFAGLGANSQKIVIGECIEAVFLGSSELAETDNALLAPALVPAIP